MKILDLYCGGGGASYGLNQKFVNNIVGVDIKKQDNYPFSFVQCDITNKIPINFDKFDFCWASPPCQKYTNMLNHGQFDRSKYPDLIDYTRNLLKNNFDYWVIENVEGAKDKLNNPIKLCGTMFDDLKVFRHRLFECNFNIEVDMECNHAPHKAMRKRGDGGDYYRVYGHEVGTTKEWQDAMNINWLKKDELTQSIPPNYSEYIIKKWAENNA